MIHPMPADEERFCYADLLSWPEDERWELIDGYAYNMTPAPSPRHQEISTLLAAFFAMYLLGQPCRVFSAPFDVRLPNPAEDGMTATTVVQPDITIVCDREKVDDRGCVGSPTMVVEILSPATAKKDLQEKYQAYEQAGVPEYWVISPGEKTLMVFTLDEQGRYGPPSVYGSDEQAPVGVLPGLVIDLSFIFTE